MDGNNGNNDWQNQGQPAPVADQGGQAPQDPAQGGWTPPADPAQAPAPEAPVAPAPEPSAWTPEPAPQPAPEAPVAPAQDAPQPGGSWDQGGQQVPQGNGDQGTGQGQ